MLLPCRPEDRPVVDNYDNTFFVCSDNYCLPKNAIRKSLTPSFFDYSLFKPTMLGDKIYIYRMDNYELMQNIQQKINFEIITTGLVGGSKFYDLKYLKENFYDKSFLNLNLSRGTGLGTAIELGLMGRKTIFKPTMQNNIQRLELPIFIHYNTIDDIIEIINQESKKIGTIQPAIQSHNVGKEWLHLNFWIK